jgi:hypothetical protein
MKITQKKTETNKKPESKSTPPKAQAPKTETTRKPESQDKASVSKESISSEKTRDSFGSFLQSFQDGFADVKDKRGDDKKADKKNPLTELKGEDLKKQLDKLNPEQKEKQLLDSLKGVEGKDLENRLAEIEKLDKDLADKLREKLGLKKEDEKKPGEEPKKAEEAKEAKKAEGKDDGAPSETFLWKPKSESDGKLVILLPTSISARSITISGPNVNETVNKGGRNGKRANGQREHFRFGRGGADMKGPVQVTVQLESGQTKTMNIANPAERNEGGKLKGGGMGGGMAA